MRTPLLSIAAAGCFLAACDSCGLLSAGNNDEGDALVTLTIGNVSFSGDIPFESWGVLQRGQPVDVVFHHRDPDSTSLEVQLLVPITAFTGPSTYACGSEFGLTETESSYCSIHVNRLIDASTSSHWNTYHYETAPGVWGPVPGCTITVSTMSPMVTGTVSCPNLPFASAQGITPDLDVPLSLTGYWEYPPYP
jgi:hypothetical protein